MDEQESSLGIWLVHVLHVYYMQTLEYLMRKPQKSFPYSLVYQLLIQSSSILHECLDYLETQKEVYFLIAFYSFSPVFIPQIYE